MATNKVEIELELSGAEEAVKSLEGIGETSKAMAERFEKDNSHLGEGLGDLTGNITEAIDSVKGLGSAFTAQGASMMTLIPAFGAVVAAGYALYETYLNISGAAEEAERAEEAMAAAVSDLQSKLEALAEKGVVPTTEELTKFSTATIEAQYAKERLQQTLEKKVTPEVEKYNDALDEMLKTQAKIQDSTKLTTREAQELGKVYLQQALAVNEARKTLSAGLDKYRATQMRVLHQIKEAAKQEEALEELSNESRLARIKENKTRLDALNLMNLEAQATETVSKEYAVLQKQEKAIFDLELERNKENEKYLKSLDERLTKTVETLDQEKIIRARGLKEIADLRKAEADKAQVEREKEMAKRQALQAAARAKRIARERQHQAELQQIRALEIESARINGASALEVLNMRYQEEIKMAEGSANKILIAVKRYENQVTIMTQEEEEKRQQIRQEAEARRLEEEKARAEHRANFIYETLEFEANLTKDQTEKELRLLEIRYARELELNSHTQEEITELNRRQAIERQNIINQSIDAQIEKIGEFSTQYGAGIAEAAYASLLFGESFNEAIGQMLIGLGRQAAVQSLMEVAKGTAALILNPAAAGNHFAAAGLFAGASAAAGVAGKALGGGGGGASSGGVASPTGTPQTAPAPEREQAEQTAMVFNINFGGAVIYDTQRAAEQALADRITNLQNTRRRGAPRRAY